MSLFVVRHGESVGNRQRIIQGDDFDPTLTDVGRQQAKSVGEAIANHCGPQVMIHTSPTRRASTTAEIISDIVPGELRSDRRIVEVDPGVLAGHSKAVAAELHPESLTVWHSRGDLDRIPEAESGDALQARVIAFLEGLSTYEATLDHIVVSHAAFNRCLLNTIRGENREKPVDIDHTTWTRIDYPPLSNLDKRPISGDGHVSVVQSVDTEYVMKSTEDPTGELLDFQEWVSGYLNRKLEIFPELHYVSRDVTVGTQLMEKVDGEHQYGPLSPERGERLCRLIKSMSNLLDQTTVRFDVKTLTDQIRSIEQSVDDPIVQRISGYLMKQEGLVNSDNLRYVHYDLHRQNVLFEGDSPRILDLEGFCFAPKLYQAAALFASGFLLEDPEDFNFSTFDTYWPGDLPRRKLLNLSLARVLIGLGYFATRPDQRREGDDRTLYNRYLASSEWIRENIGVDQWNVQS